VVSPVVDDNPHVAADEDLIEKEWVEKAKRVISETKNDPYAQEQAVSRLQADYLNKRYGKVIKLPSEE
jgi:Txe/YoeB family toxin of Txe-Axe toxin-antitoxin module